MAPHQGWLALAAAALPCTALLLLLAAVPALAGVLVASSLLTSLVWWARSREPVEKVEVGVKDLSWKLLSRRKHVGM